jgi:hypothetical protein
MAVPVRSLRPAGLPGSTTRPELSVVPARRRVAWVAMLLMIAVTGLMLGATYLHTMISERQLEIDRLDASFQAAQEEFDVLRAERSVLRSPTRLADEAGALGMAPGAESQFVPVDPVLLAVLVAQTGQMPTSDQLAASTFTHREPLDQFRLVKSASQEAP